MGTPTAAAETGAPHERRQHLRVTFSPVQRPRLHLPAGVHDVIDASLGGLRIRHADPVRPEVGHRMVGLLEWPGEEVPAAVGGNIVRVQATDVAISCDLGDLSLAYLLAESARRRDLQEGMPAQPAGDTGET
jgi:PilZ domain-containing protein